MSGLTDNDPIIREAYAELQRFYANDEMREKARERQQFLIDYHLGMTAARQEGLEEGKAVGIAEGRAEGRAEGKAEGRAEGRAEGTARGKAEGEAKAIIRILAKRFSRPSLATEEKLLAVTDIEQLDKLADLAFDCDSLDEFEAALEK